ncbi:MAG TPA: DUF2784 domain-containing protein [Gemmatimonadales bacterium]
MLADLVVLIHFAFVIFVVFGGLLALRWPKVAYVHVPVAVYGTLIELVGWICPLTPLEKSLRESAGQAGYQGGFVEHYILPVLYPGALTRGIQLLLGLMLILFNLAVYARVLRRTRHARKALQQRVAGTSQQNS